MEASGKSVNVLLVDDDEDDYILIRGMLSRVSPQEFKVEWARDYQTGLESLLGNPFEICLLDFRLDGRNGLEFLEEAAGAGCQTPIVLLTGRGDYSVDLHAMKAGAADYLVKGQTDARLLERSIRYAIERRYKQQELFRAKRIIQALSECNHAVIHSRDENELLREICRIIVEVGKYRMVWVGYAEHDEGRTVTPVAKYGHEDRYLESVNVTWRDTERGRGPMGTAIRTGAPSVVRYVMSHPEFTPWKAEALRRGYDSVIGIPIFVEGRVLGALAIYAAEPDAFDSQEVVLLSKLAENLSYGIESLRARDARRQAEETLQKERDELEQKVEERTSELMRINDRLRQAIEQREKATEALRESEARYRAIVEDQTELVCRFLPDGTLTFVNEAYCRFFGESREDLIKGALWHHLPADDREKPGKHPINNSIENSVAVIEHWVRTPQGATRCLQWTDRAVFGENGKIIEFQAVGRDITERKQAESALNASQHFLETIISSVREGVIVYDREFRYQVWNRCMEDLTGIPAKEIIGKAALDVFPHLREQGVDALLRQALEGRVVRSGDISYQISETGKAGWVAGTYSPHFDSTGSIVGVVGTIHDISERKRSEEALRESEEKYRSIFTVARDAIVLLDHETGKIIDVNKAARDLYGYTRDEMIRLSNIHLSAEPDKTVAGLKSELDRIPIRYHRKKDGTVFPVEISVGYHTQGGQGISTSVIRDITERKKSEDVLRESEERFRSLFEKSLAVKLLIDFETGAIVNANPAAGAFYGFSRDALKGTAIFEINVLPRELILEKMHEAVAEKCNLFHFKHRLATGEIRDVEVFSNPVTIRGRTLLYSIIHDITERMRAEEALRLSEQQLRLLSSQLLSAQEEERKRIANELHDSIGGVLTAIKVGMESTLAGMQEGKATPETLQALITTTQHAIEETRRIYMNLRPPILDDLGLIATIGWFTRQFQTIYPGIQVEKHVQIEEEEIPKTLKVIMFRVTQEALHNAAKHSRAKRIDLSLTGADHAIELAIADDGIGFSVEEPKERSHSGGLGLSSMQERVESTGGIFLLRSSKGGGTTVRAYWERGGSRQGR